jgi:ribosomal protein L40E/ribosomal protein L29
MGVFTMGMDELLKNIEEVESEIKGQYSELGRKLYEEKNESARSLFPELTGKIAGNRNKISEIKKQINVIKGIVICENCGAEVKNTYTFCQECGHKVKAAAAAPEGFVLCANCNTANESGSKFCKCCGSKLGAAVNAAPSPKKAEPANIQPAAVQQTPVKPAVSQQAAQQQAALQQAAAQQAAVQQAAPAHTAADKNPAGGATKSEPAGDEVSGRRCPQCGEPLDENDTFCIGCGAIFAIPDMDDDDYDNDEEAVVKEEAPVQEVSFSTEDVKECPKCGEKLGKNDTICRRCGGKILM